MGNQLAFKNNNTTYFFKCNMFNLYLTFCLIPMVEIRNVYKYINHKLIVLKTMNVININKF